MECVVIVANNAYQEFLQKLTDWLVHYILYKSSVYLDFELINLLKWFLNCLLFNRYFLIFHQVMTNLSHGETKIYHNFEYSSSNSFKFILDIFWQLQLNIFFVHFWSSCLWKKKHFLHRKYVYVLVCISRGIQLFWKLHQSKQNKKKKMHQTKKLQCTLRYRNNIKLNCWRVCCCSGCIFNTRIIFYVCERNSQYYKPP